MSRRASTLLMIEKKKMSNKSKTKAAHLLLTFFPKYKVKIKVLSCLNLCLFSALFIQLLKNAVA